MVILQSKTFRVMLVDDNRIIRDGLTMFFKIFNDLEFVGEASNGMEAIKLCEDVSPDVILMDVMMPMMNGIEATQAITSKYPHIKVVGFTKNHRKAPEFIYGDIRCARQRKKWYSYGVSRGSAIPTDSPTD